MELLEPQAKQGRFAEFRDYARRSRMEALFGSPHLWPSRWFTCAFEIKAALMSQSALAQKVIPRTGVESRSGVKDAHLEITTKQRTIFV